MNKKLTLSYSPCPNDTFIFGAIALGLISTDGLEFDIQLDDVEALNQKAKTGSVDITKLSYHALGHFSHDYQLLPSGSALGFGCGPLLISKQHLSENDIELKQLNIAIPGIYTTANYLFNYFFKGQHKLVPMLFSEIENAILNEKVDAGVIIHENRFTYNQKGLHKICDLGEKWEFSTRQPIPLGGIVVNRKLDEHTKIKVGQLIRQSIEYAMKKPQDIFSYILENAQEMEEDVIFEHIKLYVNHFSLDLGIEGRNGVEYFMNMGVELALFPKTKQPFFIES